MSNTSLEILSVLCRLLNYNADTFRALALLKPKEIKDVVRLRQNLNTAECFEVFRHAISTYKRLKAYTILHPLHEFYPERFHSINSPPVFLCTIGDLSYLREPLLTVIGSRRTLMPFTDWMDEHYTYFLRQHSVVTVSGGAYGIDAYATRLALFSGKPSILILPCGLERPYPDHVRRWIGQKNILAISEYFPDETVRKYHFVHRNRLLGSISPYLFAVQCAVKSGTMTTVRYALDCGGDIFVLPSFPGSIESAGNIHLLKEGAQLISRGSDLELGMGVLTPHIDGKNQKDKVWYP